MSPATPTPAVRFSAWQERVRAGRVLVVGDVMLDRYWFGDVERISPEAPVPVVRIARTEERPGGAANVARNAAALGARTALLSVVGDDEAGAVRHVGDESEAAGRPRGERGADAVVDAAGRAHLAPSLVGGEPGGRGLDEATAADEVDSLRPLRASRRNEQDRRAGRCSTHSNHASTRPQLDS